MINKKICIIGMGWLGMSYYNNFKKRGYNVIGYSEEPEYIGNKERVKLCDIVFIAVPTPTKECKFDGSIVKEVIALTFPGTIIVIKSTIIPEFARELLDVYPDRFILTSPEFLTEATAQYDTDFPDRNIIGIPNLKDRGMILRARKIMNILPEAKNGMVCTYEEAALIKYIGNCFFYIKNMFFNMMFDLSNEYESDWGTIRSAVALDPRIGEIHTNVIHKGGRGAGGNCLIKDFATLRQLYIKHVGMKDLSGCSILEMNEVKNKILLKKSKKNLDLLNGVYGKTKR